MARTYGSILTAIWRDGCFTGLPGETQRVLLMLATQTDISAAGTLPLTIRRWAKLAADTTEADIQASLAELAAAGFVVVDDDTEELVVVPFIRWDGGYSNPKRRPVIIEAALAVSSHAVGWAIAQEFKALDIPLAGLPDGPPDTPPDSQPHSHAGSPCDTSQPSERDVVVTEVLVASNPQPATRNPQPAAPQHTPDRFDEFYAAYPRHVGRGAARRAWTTTMRKRADPDRVIAAAAAFAERCARERADPKFVPYPATWLNAERYDDTPDPKPPQPAYWQEVTHAG